MARAMSLNGYYLKNSANKGDADLMEGLSKSICRNHRAFYGWDRRQKGGARGGTLIQRFISNYGSFNSWNR